MHALVSVHGVRTLCPRSCEYVTIAALILFYIKTLHVIAIHRQIAPVQIEIYMLHVYNISSLSMLSLHVSFMRSAIQTYFVAMCRHFE